MCQSPRQHFFNILSYSKGGQKAVSGPDSTHYETRKRGIDPEATLDELLGADIVSDEPSPLSVTEYLKKDDLLSILSDAGVEARKYWTKKRIVGSAVEGCSKELQTAAKVLKLVTPTPRAVECEEALLDLESHYERQFAVWMSSALS